MGRRWDLKNDPTSQDFRDDQRQDWGPFTKCNAAHTVDAKNQVFSMFFKVASLENKIEWVPLVSEFYEQVLCLGN